LDDESIPTIGSRKSIIGIKTHSGDVYDLKNAISEEEYNRFLSLRYLGE
jgi:hypothetical protein